MLVIVLRQIYTVPNTPSRELLETVSVTYSYKVLNQGRV